MKWLKLVLVVLGFVMLVPFIFPIRPVQGTVPPRELADADSRFVQIDGLEVHYKTVGEGEPGLVLLHGFGASVFSWRDVQGPLAEGRQVVAFDRPAFGLTERPLDWEGVNPYSQEAQVSLTIALMDQLGVHKAVLIGHSAGGAVAVQTALEYPDRVAGLVLVAPALGQSGSRGWTSILFKLPQIRRLGPLFVRSIASRGVDVIRASWHDQDTLTNEVLAGYQKPLQADNWDRALWEFTLAAKPNDLRRRLDELAMPVLVITGDDDQIVPAEASVEIAGLLGVEAVVFQNCGHLPHEEYPELFITVVREFIEGIN